MLNMLVKHINKHIMLTLLVRHHFSRYSCSSEVFGLESEDDLEDLPVLVFFFLFLRARNIHGNDQASSLRGLSNGRIRALDPHR